MSLSVTGYPTARIDMTSVNTNIGASKAALAMRLAENAQVESARRLSSGKRINGGSDDAAGVAVSSKMNAIYMGQKAAIKAATDAISLLATQEAGVEQLVNIIQRVRELAVQMSNGTYSDADRELAQLESDELINQFLMVATHTRFNKKQVLNGATAAPNMETMDIQSGPTAAENFTVALIPGVLTHTNITGATMNKISSQADAKNAVEALDTPLQTLIEASATLGSSINRLNHTINHLSQASVFTEIATGRLVDADFAKEVSINTKQSILYQAASQMLTIANDTKQSLTQLFI